MEDIDTKDIPEVIEPKEEKPIYIFVDEDGLPDKYYNGL